MNINPNIIFIIPYRDRDDQINIFKTYFNKYKEYYKWNDESVNYYFIHQCDDRPFNRGAMKNIGFLFIKNKYPSNYKNITLVFHDIDTFPITPDLINFNTNKGVIKHYYGYEFALGGIFSIKASDFEKIVGFPNLWGWGLEDNVLNDRCKGIIDIDRTTFYKINDKRIIRINDGVYRKLSNREIYIYKYEKNVLDNLLMINNLEYNENGNFVNVTNFNIKRNYNENEFENYDIRKGGKIKLKNGFFRKNWKLF